MCNAAFALFDSVISHGLLFTYASYNKKKDCANENIMPKNIVKHNTISNNFII